MKKNNYTILVFWKRKKIEGSLRFTWFHARKSLEWECSRTRERGKRKRERKKKRVRRYVRRCGEEGNYRAAKGGHGFSKYRVDSSFHFASSVDSLVAGFPLCPLFHPPPLLGRHGILMSLIFYRTARRAHAVSPCACHPPPPPPLPLIKD